MIKQRTITLAIGLALLSISMQAAVITPGQWEITIRTVQPIETALMTTEVCITRAEAERLAAGTPPKGKPKDDCVVTGALFGNVVKHTTKCKRRNVTTDAEFTYSGDRYDGVVTIDSEGTKIKQIFTAKRIGDCEADPEPVIPPPPPTPGTGH